jgi:hypothetical protein
VSNDGSGNRVLAGGSTFEFDAPRQLAVEKEAGVDEGIVRLRPRGTRDGVAASSIVDGLGRVVETGAVSCNYGGLDQHVRV